MMGDNVIAPTRSDERIDTLDVLRGIAICGILMMNMQTMGMLGSIGLPPLPMRWNLDWAVLILQQMFFSGTMRGLFTMLFGAGMLLMLRRTFLEAPQITPIDIWTRRCLALMALGVVQCAVFMWPGEILWNYGVAGLLLLAFRAARPRALLTAAAIALLAFAALWASHKASSVRAIAAGAPVAAARAAGAPLTDEQKRIVAPYDRSIEALHPTPAAIAKEYRERTHLPSLVAWSWGIWSEDNLGITTWTYLCESLGFMLIGMALYRMGILTGDAPSHVYTRLMLIGYPAGFAVRCYGLYYGLPSGYDLDITQTDVWHAGLRAVAYQPARLLITLGHVGLIITLFRRGMFGRAWPIRALGRMALTVYSLESILTSILFYGFGYVGAFGFAALMGIAVIIWIACALFCMAWLTRYEMGPAESLLRAIAYATFRRRRGEAAAAMAVAPAL